MIVIPEDLEERIKRTNEERVEIVPYDERWPRLFLEEKQHLLSCLPEGLLRRIEHFGSTAVPGLCAKPVVDLLIEVTSLKAARERIAPVLIAQGYDYFWRPSFGDDQPPWYAWFIKRGARGVRTHHLHMVTRRQSFRGHWDSLLFRDYLISHPKVAATYGRLKKEIARSHPHDRTAYTEGKTDFIAKVMAVAAAERRNAD